MKTGEPALLAYCLGPGFRHRSRRKKRGL